MNKSLFLIPIVIAAGFTCAVWPAEAERNKAYEQLVKDVDRELQANRQKAERIVGFPLNDETLKVTVVDSGDTDSSFPFLPMLHIENDAIILNRWTRCDTITNLRQAFARSDAEKTWKDAAPHERLALKIVGDMILSIAQMQWQLADREWFIARQNLADKTEENAAALRTLADKQNAHRINAPVLAAKIAEYQNLAAQIGQNIAAIAAKNGAIARLREANGAVHGRVNAAQAEVIAAEREHRESVTTQKGEMSLKLRHDIEELKQELREARWQSIRCKEQLKCALASHQKESEELDSPREHDRLKRTSMSFLSSLMEEEGIREVEQENARQPVANLAAMRQALQDKRALIGSLRERLMRRRGGASPFSTEKMRQREEKMKRIVELQQQIQAAEDLAQRRARAANPPHHT